VPVLIVPARTCAASLGEAVALQAGEDVGRASTTFCGAIAGVPTSPQNATPHSVALGAVAQLKRRLEMKTVNIPGFFAEAALYISRTQYNMRTSHHLKLTEHTVVPQLPPIFLGKTCGDCRIRGVFEGPSGTHVAYGDQECCDFYCDLGKFNCYKDNCRTEGCTGPAWAVGGGIVLNPGGTAVFNQSGGG
jgi:hypothetical protein